MGRRSYVAVRIAVWAVRAAIAVMVVGGLWLAYQRYHQSDEQVELKRFVEAELPSLASQEGEILRRLQPLSSRPGLAPAEARALLVDDVMPRIVRLRKQVSTVEARTDVVRGLTREYLAWSDRLLDACRTSLRAIDEPQIDPLAALQQIRQRFADADAAARAFNDRVRAACVEHRLAAPPAPRR